MCCKSSRESKQVNLILEQSKKKTLLVDDDEDLIDLGNPSYMETQEILEKWQRIRDKYAPETDQYVKVSVIQNLKKWMVEDKYEQQERLEEKKKYNFYQKRSKQSIFEIISMSQFRLSLYSIFNLTDDLELANLKIKKVRNQLKVVKESCEKQDDYIKQMKAQYEKSSQDIKRLTQNVVSEEPDTNVVPEEMNNSVFDHNIDSLQEKEMKKSTISPTKGLVK